MLLHLFFLAFSNANFGVTRFNSSKEYFALPHIIIPYYSFQTGIINLSRQFLNKSSENPSYIAASINCDEFTTMCSTLKLDPGSFYVSFPPHKRFQKSNRKISAQELDTFASDVSVNGLYRNITTLQQLSDLASNYPLFCLFARPNAGDLETKMPIVLNLAKLFIHRTIKFAFITEYSLYEKFAQHPLTAFVFVSPSLKYSTQRGDFTLQNLAEFVKKYEQPIWGELIDVIPNGITITIVSDNLDPHNRSQVNSIDSTIKFDDDENDDFGNDEESTNSPFLFDDFAKYETHFPMVFLNGSKDTMKAKAICGETTTCVAAVDYKRFRSIVIHANTNTTEKLRILREFNTIWAQIPFVTRVYYILANMIMMNFNTFITVGIDLILVFTLVGFFFIDKTREIPDERKGVGKIKTK